MLEASEILSRLPWDGLAGLTSRWTPCGHHVQSEKGRLAAAFS
jgi:hypothetical protein